MEVFPTIMDWEMPAYTPFAPIRDGVNTFYSWV